MTDVQKIPMKRNLIESAAIVVSILIAFALEASWESWQERQLGQAMLADLAQEIRGNIADLDSAHNKQVLRVETLNQIIREAGKDRLGLDAETLNTLLASAASTPTFDMRAGVLDQLLQGGNLSLLESAELRNRLSSLEGFISDYLANQMAPFSFILSPDTMLNTGSIFFQHDLLSLPLPDAALGAGVPWAVPPTSEQVQALKALAFVRGLTQIAMLGAPAVRNELTEILALIDEARR
jgi:hypothetical protein